MLDVTYRVAERAPGRFFVEAFSDDQGARRCTCEYPISGKASALKVKLEEIPLALNRLTGREERSPQQYQGRVSCRAIGPAALAFAVFALAACEPTPEGIARVKAEQQAFYERTFLPGAPKPGDLAYDPAACGGDHGMAEQWYQDLRGYPRIGPPQMSICR